MKNKTKLLTMSCILGTSLLISTSVFAKGNININRLAGQDRYGTSNAIVSQGWTQSNYAILVNSENFPDAITSSPLAKKYSAPILLTDCNTLTDSTTQKLQSLGVKNVFIIGGTGVVSNNVKNTLENMGISVKRIWGQDRYETSVNVAKELGASNGVFVVSGEHYEDALSVAPIADKLQYPIILTSKDSVPDIVKNYVNNIKNNGGKVEVIGGDDVLNSNVISTLNTTKTYNQSSKYDRNLALINNYKGQLDLSKVYIASDKGFADALSGSALAGQNGNPIILVGDSNQITVNSFISNNNISNVNVLGGTGVLSNYVVNAIIGNTTATDTGNSIVTFKDKNLEKVVRNAIKKSTGDIYKSDIENITSLCARNNGIQDISGIENLTNLQTLELMENKISNIGALKGLTNLKSINLSGNQISDIRPLEGLTNLKLIDLAVNKISDIGPLEGLTNLQEISLNNNKISDMSALKGLTNVNNLGICMNKISDISALKGLTNLKDVDLSKNQISDISSLKESTNLEILVSNENQISDVRPLEGLTNLQYVYLNKNQINDISPLKKLNHLKFIWLYNNPISDYDKKSLSNALPNCDVSYSKIK